MCFHILYSKGMVVVCACARARMIVWPFNGHVTVTVIVAATLTVIASVSLLVAASFP